MTVIAWDGHTVAADKMAFESHATSVKKLHTLEDGTVLAVTGRFSHGMELIQWARDGFIVDKFPDEDKFDAKLVVFPPVGNIRVYEGPHPWECEGKKLAFGCGGPVAIGALFAGASAIEAVKICNEYAEGCGLGVDSVTIRPQNG